MDTDSRVRMFAADVARAAGISEASVARYHSMAKTSRDRAARFDAGQPRPGDEDGRLPQPRDMPAPDGHGYPPGRSTGSKSPWWWPETIAPWLAVRQGPGKPRNDGEPVRQHKEHARPGPRPRRRRAPATA